MRNEIIIVSGLPRSGTSLMMQMLNRGGIKALTDEMRKADEDNPLGYFEVERVKRLQQDASWLPEVRGKAIKVISQLLFSLPETENYAVILMQRELEEVLDSQEAMLARQAMKGGGNRELLSKAFTTHLTNLSTWLPEQEHLRVLPLNYADVVVDPQSEVAKLNDFLEGRLDCSACVEAVDPELYRNRSS
ncbi:sulfotransferase domain-containing protein [Adhaeretor mobilis]|uniref:Sulfotransferase domain protein n=1 Tax=Adhaeretor mobilis TaxID=1930276 RepID=A0A517MZD5_9BACT|nr:sulfotransferase domain-containing protein [Adhaeretor mobilis]QDT00225.1 Sulfotransferase domain protein [Adhaeretor mobilis]